MFTKEFENEKKLFDGYSITNSNDSIIAVAKREIIVPKIILPEKKIIILDEASENEKAIINSITKGGITL